MKRLRAAIDIGTHTARLLIVNESETSGRITPVSRKREYIYLAEHYDYLGKKIIQPKAVDRTLNALQSFLQDINRFKVDKLYAIATGIIREAENRGEFLNKIFEKTNIPVKILTGDEEATLTAKGVMQILNIQSRPILVFDLGGGTTEFFFADNETQTVKSIPLGAMILTRGFIETDPPKNIHIDSLSEHIDKKLKELIPEFIRTGDKDPLLVGTGGTVTTLAMVLNKIAPEEVSADQVNGLVLERQEIEKLSHRMKNMRFDERVKLTGLDKGRAGIIVAGTLVVIKILYFFNALKLTVSMSDLLEGILIENLNLV